MKKRLNFLVSLLLLSLFACQDGVKFNAISAAAIPTGFTQEIPSVLICGYNSLITRAINDSIIEYKLEIFKGWQNKYKIKKGKATKFYPKITDPKIEVLTGFLTVLLIKKTLLLRFLHLIAQEYL